MPLGALASFSGTIMHGLNRQAQASLRQFLPDVHNRAINPPYLLGQNSDVFKTSLCRIKGKEN